MSALKKSIFILPFLLFIGLLNESHAQSDQGDLAEFLILTQTNRSSVILTCEKGCDWDELTIDLEVGQSQAVNQSGFTDLQSVRPAQRTQSARFLFNLKRTDKGLSFEGKLGTAWKELSFTCKYNRCNQYIDQKGMVEN